MQMSCARVPSGISSFHSNRPGRRASARLYYIQTSESATPNKNQAASHADFIKGILKLDHTQVCSLKRYAFARRTQANLIPLALWNLISALQIMLSEAICRRFNLSRRIKMQNILYVMKCFLVIFSYKTLI